MNRVKKNRGILLGLITLLALAACGKPQEPARHSLQQVQSAVSAVAPLAQKYSPAEFSALQVKANDLQASFDKGDFKQVLADAPTLLNTAQALGATAAAKKDQIVKVMSAEWTSLTEAIPDQLAAVQARIDSLPKTKKQAAGVDLPGAKSAIAEAMQLWDQAQQAMSASDVEAAVEDARLVSSKIQSAATALNFSLQTS